MSFFVAYEGDGGIRGRFYVRGTSDEEALEHARNGLKGIAVRTASLRFTPSPEPLHVDGSVVALYSASTGWETSRD